MIWFYAVITALMALVLVKVLFTSEKMQEQILAGLILLPMIWRLFFFS